MGGVSSVLNPGQQAPAVVVPDDYVTPSFPSLYSPSAESTLSNTGHFLYQAYTIWRFTLYWTLILIGGTFFLCSIAAFLTTLLSLTIFRRPPNLPPTTSSEDTEREKLRPKRKRPPLWPVLLIPLVWSALGAIVALISGTIVGFVLGAVYSAGGFSMSTWVPFLWAWIQVLVLIISSYSTLASIL